jgi:hypothetical protein
VTNLFQNSAMSGMWTVMSRIYSWLLTLLSIFAIVFNRVYILYKRRLLQRSEKQVEQFNAVEKR